MTWRAWSVRALAALLLSVVSYQANDKRRGSHDTRGLRIYVATPRLRGLLALNLAIASGSAMVIVNTVVLEPRTERAGFCVVSYQGG